MAIGLLADEFPVLTMISASSLLRVVAIADVPLPLLAEAGVVAMIVVVAAAAATKTP